MRAVAYLFIYLKKSLRRGRRQVRPWHFPPLTRAIFTHVYGRLVPHHELRFLSETFPVRFIM